MTNFLKRSVLALCGLATSIAVAVLITVGERLTGYDLFTFNIWVIVPAGAILTGLAAASGYYFGSLFFHMRPTPLAFVQMVAIAGLTFVLIYYLEYATLTLDDGRHVSDYMSFWRYFTFVVTTAHYQLGHGQIDTGELGEAGYWVAAIQFIGFLVGGVAIFAFLLNHPFCDVCKKYLRVIAKVHRRFPDSSSVARYHEGLFVLPMDTPEFAAAAAVVHDAKTERGATQLVISLIGCPECRRQQVSVDAEVYDGRDWKSVDALSGHYFVPDGTDLTQAYRPDVT
jgi:hypothetical protein